MATTGTDIKTTPSSISTIVTGLPQISTGGTKTGNVFDTLKAEDAKSMFIVFNDVTQKVEESLVAPKYEDPNATKQKDMLNAYNGTTDAGTGTTDTATSSAAATGTSSATTSTATSSSGSTTTGTSTSGTGTSSGSTTTGTTTATTAASGTGTTSTATTTGTTTTAAATKPVPATIGDPAAVVVQASVAALGNGGIPNATHQKIMQTLGSLIGLASIPSMLFMMNSHATNILSNVGAAFNLMRPIDNIFAPDLTGTASSVGAGAACNTLSPYMGSMQGQYNGTMAGMTSNLGVLGKILQGAPVGVIATYATQAATIAALLSSSKPNNSAILAANVALGVATNALTNVLGTKGQAALGAINNGANLMNAGIQGEMGMLNIALGLLSNNPFVLVPPNPNPCVNSILATANSVLRFF